MNWTLMYISKCIKHIKLAVSDIFDGYLRCLLNIIIYMQGFVDISSQISVFPANHFAAHELSLNSLIFKEDNNFRASKSKNKAK